MDIFIYSMASEVSCTYLGEQAEVVQIIRSWRVSPFSSYDF